MMHVHFLEINVKVTREMEKEKKTSLLQKISDKRENRDTQTNDLVKDIRNDEMKPENNFEGSILPKLSRRWLFSEQKHIWECLWKET